MNPILILNLLLNTASAEPSSICDSTHFKVGIDVGHSSEKSGARSASGLKEYDFNLKLANVLLNQLHGLGYKNAFIIDQKGKSLGLGRRVRLAEKKGATILLSVHHDSVQPQFLKKWMVNGQEERMTREFSGFSLFVSARSGDYKNSLQLAEHIGDSLTSAGFSPSPHHAEAIPGENRPFLNPELGVYRYDGLGILRRAKIPAVLFEAGVIVNPDEESKLLDSEYQRKMAQNISKGLLKFCRLKSDSD